MFLFIKNAVIFLKSYRQCQNLPQPSGDVIACNILNDLLGIELPVYFFGSGTVCWLGCTYCCWPLPKSIDFV